MSGYVEAGYTVVGVTLVAYTLWILLRSRSIARALPARHVGVVPARGGEAAETAAEGAEKGRGWR